MASLIDENTQFLDSAGSPIVNGYIYVGTQNLDPVTNTITIYSDRELTVSISNPQRTDANGRSTNKIWVPAKYSLKVEDENNVQQYLELDNGEIEQTGISLLTNVLGTDTITAEGAPAITSLVDNQQYNFRAANTNTGTVTLQIDLTAAKTIKKLHDVDLVAGDIEQNQTVSVVYNSVDDVFEITSNVSTSVSTEVTGHTRAGNMQILNGDTTITDEVVTDDVITATWESYGPTGSGADNIIADMDNVPGNATIVIIDCELFVTPSGTSTATLALYATSGSVGSPAQDIENNRIARIQYDPNEGATNAGNNQRLYIPVDSNLVFKVYWTVSNATSQGISFFYRGFMTD